MKITRKIIYLLFCISLFASCMQSELESIPAKSVKVTQGNAGIQDQGTVIEYGTLRVLKDAVTKNYTLTNTSGQVLRFSKITSDNGDFLVKLEKDTTALFPQESLNFTVTFSPKLGGETVGKISFSTNDPAYPVFSFGVKGKAVAPPQIIGNNSPQFDELNTVSLGAEGNATRFTVELYVEDLYNRITPSQLSIDVQAKFGNGEKASFIKTPSEITISDDNKRILYSFVVRFGDSQYIDMDNALVLGNGDISNTHRIRIERPQGAE